MSRSVVILCPNGRRKVFKFNQTSTVNQILEEFCKKEKYDSSLFDLKNQRTTLERCLQWRFCNLPNNAKLELIPRSSKDEDAEVRIAVQHGGGREEAVFKSSSTLQDVMEHFGGEIKGDGVPVFVYMRQEFVGTEVLSGTRLSSVGVNKGSALMRFFYRPTLIPENKTQIISKQREIEELTPGANSRPHDLIGRTNETSDAIGRPIESSQTKNSQNSTFSETLNDETCGMQATGTVIEDKLIEDKLIEDKLIEDKQSSKVKRKIDISPSVANKRLKLDGNLGNTELVVPSNELLASNPSNQNLHISTNLAQKTTNQGTEISTNQGTEISTNQGTEESFQQNPLLFYENTSNRNSEGESVPDEFFEVTLDDVRKMMANLKHDRQRLEEKQLVTDDIRKRRREEMMQKHPGVIVRFVFGSRHILQGNFLTRWKVEELYNFVEEQTGLKDFYLFTTPPKALLKNKQEILFDRNIVRASRIYVGGAGKDIGAVLQSIIDSKQS